MSARSQDGSGDDWVPAAFLAAAAILSILFYRDFVFSPGRMLFGSDMIDQAYQLRKFGVDEIRAGRGVPLWNPYVSGGLPYLAVLPGPIFYPSSLLYFVLPLYRAIGWTFVLHTFLAGAFAYFAARSFRLARSASVVCGFAFMFTGYVVSHLYGGQDGRMFAMTLVPLAFGLLERGLRSGRLGWFLGLGAVVALQVLTPHVQVMYFSSLSLAFYLLYHLLVRVERDRGVRAYARPAGLFALAFVLAALLGAVQLLPTYGLLEHAIRGSGESGYAFASSWALPPQELTAFFLPDLIGSLGPLPTPDALGTYWGSNGFKLHTEYLGIVPLALGTIAVAGSIGRGGGSKAAFDREVRRNVWFFAGASVLGVAFALGSATPVHRIGYALLPMIKGLRAPAMMLGPVSFFVAMLAGLGWQRVLGAGVETGEGGARPLPWAWILGLSAPFLGVGLFAAASPAGLLDFVYLSWYPAGWPRQPAPGLASLVRTGGLILLFLWLVTLATAFGVARRRIGEWAVLGLLVLLVADLWRIDARYLRTVDPDEVFEADGAVEYMAAELRPGERVWQLEGTYGKNELMYFGIPSIAGSQNFRLRWTERLVGGLGYENMFRSAALWPLFDLRYATSRSELDIPILRPVAEREGKRVYEVDPNVPHAFFPAAVRLAADTADALRSTLAVRDPREVAVVEMAGPIDAGAGSAELLRYEAGRIQLRVRAEAPGLLFVSEIFHPDWRATLDGETVPVLRTNVAFQGVEVPAGEHELLLLFLSPDYRMGRLLSLGTLVAVLAYLLLRGVRRRTAREES